MEVVETVKSFGLQEELKGSIGPSLDQGIFTLLFSSINPFPSIPRVVSRRHILTSHRPLFFLSSRLDHFLSLKKLDFSHLFFLVESLPTLTSVIATVYSIAVQRSLDTLPRAGYPRTSFFGIFEKH